MTKSQQPPQKPMSKTFTYDDGYKHGYKHGYNDARQLWPEPIIDRPPTAADGDESVGWVQALSSDNRWICAKWDYVSKYKIPWLHTPCWEPRSEPTLQEQALKALDRSCTTTDEDRALIRRAIKQMNTPTPTPIPVSERLPFDKGKFYEKIYLFAENRATEKDVEELRAILNVSASPVTDKLRLQELLDDFGVEYAEKRKSIICRRGNKGITGYFNFYVAFLFADDESFVEMGAYE